MSAENARWQAALDGLERIAHDPTETEARRRKAQNALGEMTRTTPTFASELGSTVGVQRHTSGDVAAAAQVREYEGFSA